MDTNQTDHMTVAISKLFNEKTYKLARNAIEPGTHDVPVLIHGAVCLTQSSSPCSSSMLATPSSPQSAR
jgi:hypothetical protein